jgi:hypothetical protein
MARFAALFAYCLCFATITMASNQDQWTGTPIPEKATLTLPNASYRNVLEASQGDRRANVMQTTKLRMPPQSDNSINPLPAVRAKP